ncbi:ankyrin repeat domain-containing protein [Rickettsia endosymbiont of Cantharis rufa]|uniref:ankyrin repeat domain-containing protein n=1 Tax=Rickettsia endosymbiont of Cantharis rufa TaxID=3066248 RepID=UPI003132D425
MHYHASTNITPQEQFLYDLGFNVGIASWGSVTKDGVITYTTTDFLTDRTLYDLTDILSDNITVDYMVDTIIRNERSTFGKYLQCNSNTAAAYDGAYYIQCKLEYFFTQQRAGSIDLKILENFLDLLVGYNSESNCTSRNTPDFDLALLNAIIYMKDNGVIKVLLKYVNNPNINIGDIPIIIAVLEDDNIELFNMLLAFGADLNITSYVDGTSPLHIASQNSLQEVATALINNGADPNIRDNKGNTPLIYAILAKEPKKEIIELLITSSNINLDIKNDDAQSALHIATKYNHINIVKLLLDAGVNVNAVNDDGDTALHLALQYHYMDIAKLLFSNSEVDIYVPNNLSLTPVQLAISLVADDHELEKLMHSKVTITRHHLNISNNKAESKIAVETDDLNKSAHDQELAVQGQDNNIYDTILT